MENNLNNQPLNNEPQQQAQPPQYITAADVPNYAPQYDQQPQQPAQPTMQPQYVQPAQPQYVQPAQPQYVQPAQPQYVQQPQPVAQPAQPIVAEPVAVQTVQTAKVEQAVDNSNDNKIFRSLSKIFNITIQSLLLIAFIFGIASISGTSITVLNFFYNIMDLFKLNGGNWYYYVASCGQGITYLVVAIILITQYCRSIAHWKYGAPITLRAYTSDMLKNCVIYYILVASMKEAELTTLGLVIFIISAILLALALLTEKGVKEKITLEYVFQGPVAFLIKTIAFSLIIKFVIFDCFSQIINGFVTFGSINYEEMDGFIYIIFENLGMPIIGIISMGFMISLAGNIFFNELKYQCEIWRKLMILACVTFGLHLLFYMAFSSSDADSIEKIGDFIKMVRFDVLPFLLISIGGFVLSYSLKPVVTKKVLNTPAGQVKY